MPDGPSGSRLVARSVKSLQNQPRFEVERARALQLANPKLATSAVRTIPGVLYRIDPAAREVPLVFDSPHSGADYPDDFGFKCALSLLRTAEDAYVDELFGAAPEFGATLIGALFPRSYIDVNRDVGDIDATLIEGPWLRKVNPSERTRLGMGLIRTLAAPGVPLYEGKIPVEALLARIDRYFLPYHAELQTVLDRLHAAYGAVWHVNCHSMQSVSDALASEGPGIARADVVLGDRDGTTCAADFTVFVHDFFADRGYQVRVNDPFKGVELIRRHGRPSENRHSLQIELNRRLYMDERSLERNADFAKLQADTKALIQALSRYVGGS